MRYQGSRAAYPSGEETLRADCTGAGARFLGAVCSEDSYHVTEALLHGGLGYRQAAGDPLGGQALREKPQDLALRRRESGHELCRRGVLLDRRCLQPLGHLKGTSVVYKFDVLLERQELEAQDVALGVHVYAGTKAGLPKGDGLVVLAVPNADVEGPRLRVVLEPVGHHSPPSGCAVQRVCSAWSA